MSIVWVHELNTSETMDQNVQPESASTTYIRMFQVLTDSMDDGCITVSTAVDPTSGLRIPQIFSIYEKGSDRDQNAVATRCHPRRDKIQPLLWEVTVTYTAAVGFDLAGSSGELDITCYLPSARSWKIPLEKTIWKARLQLPALGGGAAEDFAAAMAKAKEPIVNSCNKLFAEGITTLRHATGWEIGRYEWYYNKTQADAYTDAVNSDEFWGYAAGTVRMAAITGHRRTMANLICWLVTYEFHVDPEGWGESILDNGMERWCAADGTVPATIGDVAGQCAIKDEMGIPVSAPVLLDGLGYLPAGVSAPLAATATPVVVTWHHLEQQAFASIQPPFPSMDSLNIITVT